MNQKKSSNYKSFYITSGQMEERGIVERREDGKWYWVQPDFRNPNLPGTQVALPEQQIVTMAQ